MAERGTLRRLPGATAPDLTGRGRAAVRAELRALGVDEEVSRAALEEEYSPEQEEALAAALAERALAGLDELEDPVRRAKKVRSLQRRLLSRGFGSHTVLAVTEKYLEDGEDD
ncbi:MAG: RecX family transcriptional regulator [Firmicutes bacterium]|nr:RecX family transcriptional regulator [Bacillota bacterium]